VALGVGVALWNYKLGQNEAREYQAQNYPERPSGICIKLPFALGWCPQEQGGTHAENQRSDDDLKAQQEMADWAFVVAVTGAYGLILSLVGVVLIYATFHATRKTLAAAYEANDIGWYQTAAQLSFDARVLYMHESTKPPLRPNILIHVANSGVTAARNLSAHGKWRLLRGDETLLEGESTGPEYDRAIDVDGNGAGAIDLNLNKEVDAACLDDLLAGTVKWVVDVVYRYRTIAGERSDPMRYEQEIATRSRAAGNRIEVRMARRPSR
jgi:hypothetical protein